MSVEIKKPERLPDDATAWIGNKKSKQARDNKLVSIDAKVHFKLKEAALHENLTIGELVTKISLAYLREKK